MVSSTKKVVKQSLTSNELKKKMLYIYRLVVSLFKFNGKHLDVLGPETMP